MYLFAMVNALVIGSLLRVFFPFGPVMDTVWAVLGALVFSLYIIFDTFLLINEFKPDDFIIATLTLYLDIINLFINILQIVAKFAKKDH